MADQDLDQLRQDAERQREAIATDLEYVGDRVSPGRIVERRRAAVVSRFQGARSSVFGSPDASRGRSSDRGDGSSVKDQAGDAMDRVKEKTPDSMADFAEGNPLAAGLIGVGVGLLVATLIPGTPEEQKMADQAQGKIDDVAGELGRSGREAAENVKPAAQEAAQNVKASAQDSAQTVQSDTKAAAQDVKDSAQDQRDQIQSDG